MGIFQSNSPIMPTSLRRSTLCFILAATSAIQAAWWSSKTFLGSPWGNFLQRRRNPAHTSGEFSTGTSSFSSSSSSSQHVTPAWCLSGAIAVTACGGLFRKTIRGTRCARLVEAKATTQAEPAEAKSAKVKSVDDKTLEERIAKKKAEQEARAGPPVVKPKE